MNDIVGPQDHVVLFIKKLGHEALNPALFVGRGVVRHAIPVDHSDNRQVRTCRRVGVEPTSAPGLTPGREIDLCTRLDVLLLIDNHIRIHIILPAVKSQLPGSGGSHPNP